MHDLIYKFLIQSGYSRASIVTDITSVNAKVDAGDASFVIVNPDTVERLAVIGVVGPLNAETLIDQASVVARATHQIGGKQAQGFVVRVDAKAKREQEQVQFYRCYPNTALQQITARAFPDLDTLKVNHKLTAPSPVTPQGIQMDAEDEWDAPVLSKAAYLPAIALIVLALIDWAARTIFNTALFELSHSLMLLGGVVLLTMPAMFRYLVDLRKG